MATTATEQPVLDRLTVLSSGGEHGKEVAFSGKRGEKSVDFAAKLRNVRPAGGKETIRAGLALKEGETKYNWRNSKDFLDRFGSGKKLSEMSASEKASYQKARDVMQTNTIISLFLEAKGLPDNPPTLRDAYLTTNKVEIQEVTGIVNPTYNQIKTVALKFIVNDRSFNSMFPELRTSAMNEASMMDFAEKTLFPAEDQRMVARLGTRLQEAYKQSLRLTDVVTDNDRENYRRQQNDSKLTLEQKAKQIADFLDNKGILSATSAKLEVKDIIQWVTQSGTSPEGTVDSVIEKALGCTHQEFSEMIQFREAAINMPTLEASFKVKHAAGPYAGSPFDIAGYLAGNPTDLDVIKYKQHDAAHKIGLPNYNLGSGKRTLYEKFDNTFYPLLKDPGLQGFAKEAKEAQVKMDSMDIKLKGLPVITTGEEKAYITRLIEEEDLCGIMDGILGQSIADVIEERYDVMEERIGRLNTEDQKKAEQDTQKLILELKKKMNSNWIGYNASTHKKTVKKDQIKKDVTHMAFTYDKDMALKQIIARDLFAGHGGVALTNTNFDKLNIIDGKDEAGTVLLSEDKLKQVNEVFKLAGQEYRDKLFADLLAARTFGDRSWNFGFGIEVARGSLGFKRDEWQQMLKLYEPEITKGIEGNKEASAALKGLEAQGLRIDTNLKWLWYVLAVLLGGATGGFIGPGVTGLASNIAGGIGAQIAAGNMMGVAGEIGGAVAGGIGAKKVVEHFSEN